MTELTDRFNRKHEYLRISLTDNCNLNCIYCSPIGSCIPKTEKKDILTYEEIIRIVNLFAVAGFKKFRFTGGEPLLRRDVLALFEKLSELRKKYKFELLITTNGILLHDKIDKLMEYGVERLNISLDSLKSDNFIKINGSKDYLQIVIDNIEQAIAADIKIKINTVIIRGINETELIDFCDFSIKYSVNVRFIEFMPFSSNNWNKEQFISSAEMREIISAKYLLKRLDQDLSTSDNYLIEGTGGMIGFINPISDHFCSSCNRLRISSDSNLKLCLFSESSGSINFKKMINQNYTDSQMLDIISAALQNKESEHSAITNSKLLLNNEMLNIGG
ncbi:MAG: GTP 3',8-cyclase MoaA [Candidatus Kapabacteria bacterium]|nr:GTP 3',8-cyclase MoaA [Candidatus Kapabacteria bacterium]